MAGSNRDGAPGAKVCHWAPRGSLPLYQFSLNTEQTADYRQIRAVKSVSGSSDPIHMKMDPRVSRNRV